jgi:hypothetical protein
MIAMIKERPRIHKASDTPTNNENVWRRNNGSVKWGWKGGKISPED